MFRWAANRHTNRVIAMNGEEKSVYLNHNPFNGHLLPKAVYGFHHAVVYFNRSMISILICILRSLVVKRLLVELLDGRLRHSDLRVVFCLHLESLKLINIYEIL